MAFKVFLSCGSEPEEQVLAWRLRTLTTAHGIHVFVPQRDGQPGLAAIRRSSKAQFHRGPVEIKKVLADDARRKIDGADCVLAMIIGEAGPYVEAELGYALSKRKVAIPVVQEGVSMPASLARLPRFEFSLLNPGKVESDVIKLLKRNRFSKQNQQAVSALIAIGLGLLLLSALPEE